MKIYAVGTDVGIRPYGEITVFTKQRAATQKHTLDLTHKRKPQIILSKYLTFFLDKRNRE